VVADIAKLSVGREAYYTRELATDHQQYLSGHGESPGRWYGAGATTLGLQAKHPWPGFRPSSRAGTPPLASCWAAPTAAAPSRPSTWSCGRPRASRFSTASAMRPPAGRCWPPITRDWPKRPATWTSTWAPAAATLVSSMCPEGGCWRLGSTTGRPEKATRCCTPTWWWPTGCRGRTAAGLRWMAATCIGIGWPPTRSTGPPTRGSCPGHSGLSGQLRTPTATGSSRACPRSCCGCSPSVPARLTWRWSGWRARVGSGPRGWSSGPCMSLASPKPTRPRTPCMDGGGRRRPSAATTPTPWSGR
jgi:hypothetical protein